MRVLAIADVEDDLLLARLSHADPAHRYDLVISCGDLRPSYLDSVATLANAPLAYVRGNHDTSYEDSFAMGGINLDRRIERIGGLRFAGLEGSLNYWWGMSADVVRLELGEGIATGQRRLLQTLRQALLEGRLHPFEGMLVAQKGQVVRPDGAERLSHEEIASMRWLNENVVGRLPKSWELTPEGADAVAASGVISAETDAAEE